MQSRRLGYPSLKAVLLHTDANTRIRISLYIPSVSSIERMIPLKIDRLSLDQCSTTINDICYELGTIRHYPDGGTFWPINTEISPTGARCDYDEFGFPVLLGGDVVLPGDVSFESENSSQVRCDGEHSEKMHQCLLRAREKALEKLAELHSKGISAEDYLKSLEPLPSDKYNEEEERYRKSLGYSSEHLRSLIRVHKQNLLPFAHRRTNRKHQFKCYIQLTIKKGTSTQILIFECHKKLFEAVKCFNEALFGGRPMPIEVRNLRLSFNPDIFRLPIGFRLWVHNANVFPHMVTHNSLSLLVENSEHLDSLQMPFPSDLDAFQSSPARNAKRLAISGVIQNDLRRLIPVVGELSNLEISILPREMVFSSEDYFDLIQAWLARDRRFGAYFGIRMRDEDTAREVLQMIGRRFENTETNERCVTIHPNDETEVEILYVPFEGPNRCLYDTICNWILEVRIVKI